MVPPGGGVMDGVRLPGESDISDEIGGWAGVNQARARGAFRVMGQQQESTLHTGPEK